MQSLKDILSGGSVDVLEVEQQARAAALLEDDKRLSKNKAFRDARTSWINSARDGFGPGSRYVLELPDAPWAPLPKQGRLWMIWAPMEGSMTGRRLA